MSKYEVKSVVCDYGVFEDNELKLICNSQANALKIKEILETDSDMSKPYVWQDKTISDLEAKLAESEERCTKMWKWEVQQINRLQEENNQLKQQLVEKDEQIKELTECNQYLQIYRNQDKISFAVEQLEQLRHDIWTDQQDDGWLDKQVDIYFLNKTIDNQIEELKKEIK